jgi:hypothetical protein
MPLVGAWHEGLPCVLACRGSCCTATCGQHAECGYSMNVAPLWHPAILHSVVKS